MTDHPYFARWEPGLCGSYTKGGFVCTKAAGHEEGSERGDEAHYHHKSGSTWFEDDEVGRVTTEDEARTILGQGRWQQ